LYESKYSDSLNGSEPIFTKLTLAVRIFNGLPVWNFMKKGITVANTWMDMWVDKVFKKGLSSIPQELLKRRERRVNIASKLKGSILK
jgi:hypothetical protein